ncbi:hypothetical protein BLOT_015589 [Blomia tropicalis]|nr:hypothetical protein BLOT_015589 [Blomia tropicalis]
MDTQQQKQVTNHSNLIDAKAIPFNLMFPIPIPEPPRVISNGPYVPDISITSEVDSTRNRHVNSNQVASTQTNQQQQSIIPNKIKLKQNRMPLKTTIHPTDSVLRQLRQRYGVIPVDINDCGYSSDETNKPQIINNKPKSTKTFVKTAKENVLRKQMYQVQSDLRMHIEKLQPLNTSTKKSKSKSVTEDEETEPNTSTSSGSSSGISSQESSEDKTSCSCKTKMLPTQPTNIVSTRLNQELLSPSSSSTTEHEQMLECIRKQNLQLQQISSQMEQLLRIHQNSDNKAVNKCKTTNSIKLDNNFDEQSCTKCKKLPSTRKFKHPSAVINVPSSSEFIDSSIERARQAMKKNLQHSASSDEDEPSKQSVDSTKFKNRQSEDFYTNMITTINSILIRNSSMESSNNSDMRASSESNDRRSSSPSLENINSDRDESGIFIRSTSKPKTKRIHKQTEIKMQATTKAFTPTTSSPKVTTRVRKRYLHSEQSLYIQKLASKYELEDVYVDDDDEIRIDEEDSFQRYLNQRTNRLKANQDRNKSNRLLKLQEEDEHIKVYGLPDHNTSFATKNYLDKYGLHCSTPVNLKQNNCRIQHRTVTRPKQMVETLFEVDESRSSVEGSNHRLEATEMIKGDNNCQPRIESDETFSRILDLDSIKNLPKLI